MKIKKMILMVVMSFLGLSGFITATDAIGTSIVTNIQLPGDIKPEKLNDNLWYTDVYEPGAAWIKIHFTNFRLNDNDFVELIDKNNYVIERIKKEDLSCNKNSRLNIKTNDNRTFDFWGPAIDGDKVKISFHRATIKGNGWGFSIDEIGIGVEPINNLSLNSLNPIKNERIDKLITDDSISTTSSIEGCMLYKNGMTWYTCNGYMMSDNQFQSSGLCIASIETEDTVEVRFYLGHNSAKKNIPNYCTFYSVALSEEYFNLSKGVFTLRNNPMIIKILEQDYRKNPNLPTLYFIAQTYANCSCNVSCTCSGGNCSTNCTCTNCSECIGDCCTTSPIYCTATSCSCSN